MYSNADAVIEIKPNALNASSDDVPAELGAEHEQVKALFSLNVDENDPDLKEKCAHCIIFVAEFGLTVSQPPHNELRCTGIPR